MKNTKDLTARLPDGTMFEFWETDRIYDRELHVDGSTAADDGDGSPERPFRTINAAAQAATPGTRVRIHAGTYRETVQPARGGEGPDRMITYEPAGDGEVFVKASVEAHDFRPSEGWSFRRAFESEEDIPQNVRIWEIELDPEDFKGYNPFCAVNIIHDRLYIEYGKTDMTSYLNRRGMVFVDGKPMKQVALFYLLATTENAYWVEANGQKVHIRLTGDDHPDNHLIELTNREQCFAPRTPFLSYIHVRGMTFAHAAMGCPVPQRGSISCFRGHHWIIEDCVIDWSNAVGIDCGNECWHREPIEGQVLGYTIIRRNTIRDVGVCGIAGIVNRNLLIEDNLIERTGWQRMERSWEAAGIKLHHAVDALIRRNVIRTCYGCDALWLDVGNENCRITSNLMLDGIDSREHIFLEASRDRENLVDNNILWNVEGRYDRSAVAAEAGSSGWYKLSEAGVVKNGYGIYLEGTDHTRMVNNLIGRCNYAGFYAKPVPFRISRMKRGGTSRNSKFYNNLFYRCGDAAIVMPTAHNECDGNAYTRMPGGFLRVMYPEPEMCLDLPNWQAFCGFDPNGSTPDLDVDIDTDALTMAVTVRGDLPEVAADRTVDTDFFGAETGKRRVPGPIEHLDGYTMRFPIDPRRSE